MNKFHRIVVASCLYTTIFGVATVITKAQGPNEGFILDTEANNHLLPHSDPIYPPIAKAAHIQGSVLIHADVNATGKVTHVEAIGGPPMLRGAAIEAVQGWAFRPFTVNGFPSSVKIALEIPFSLGIPSGTALSDETVGQAYFPELDICRSDLARGNWESGVLSCGKALDTAQRFPDPSMRYSELRTVHQKYGEALLFHAQATEALKQFQEAVALAHKNLTEIDEEYGETYNWQALAEQSLGMHDAAEQDYVVAERSYRLALQNLPDMKTPYGHALAHCLAYHSVLVFQTGDTKRANEISAEALQLDPHVYDAFKPKD